MEAGRTAGAVEVIIRPEIVDAVETPPKIIHAADAAEITAPPKIIRAAGAVKIVAPSKIIRAAPS
jgi:RPA family protein